MNKVILSAVATIPPTVVADPATRTALSAWHEEIAHMVRLARLGEPWTPSRSQQEREVFLAELVAKLLVDMAKTALEHTTVCGQAPPPQDIPPRR